MAKRKLPDSKLSKLLGRSVQAIQGEKVGVEERSEVKELRSRMCSRCDGFLERRRINSAYEYRDLVRQLVEIIQQGTFRLVRGSCALEDILKPKRLPGDLITHIFECTTCSRRFSLEVETYHGSGGDWEVMTHPSTSSTTQ